MRPAAAAHPTSSSRRASAISEEGTLGSWWGVKVAATLWAAAIPVTHVRRTYRLNPDRTACSRHHVWLPAGGEQGRAPTATSARMRTASTSCATCLPRLWRRCGPAGTWQLGAAWQAAPAWAAAGRLLHMATRQPKPAPTVRSWRRSRRCRRGWCRAAASSIGARRAAAAEVAARTARACSSRITRRGCASSTCRQAPGVGG